MVYSVKSNVYECFLNKVSLTIRACTVLSCYLYRARMRGCLLLLIVAFGFSSQLSVAGYFDESIIFVGERISLEPAKFEDSGRSFRDRSFQAHYKILELVSGTYSGVDINFRVFDHYGDPEFSKHKTVLLFVHPEKGYFYHHKYKSFDVYRTKNDRWATCGDPYRWFNDNLVREIESEEIEFVDEVSYELKSYPRGSIEKFKDQKYYEIRNGIAYCRGLGNYVEDISKSIVDGVVDHERINKMFDR